MDNWSVEHRIFAVSEFNRNGESIVSMRRAFHCRFELGVRDILPVRNTILRWVNNFRTRGSVAEKKKHH